MRMRPSFAICSSAVALVVLGFLGVPGCGRRAALGPAGSSGELPDTEVNDFALTETEQGRPEWKLYARYAATYSARDLVVARAVRVDFFDDRAQRTSTLTAREGEINDRTKNMTARGNVVLETTEGTRLSTEELCFLNARQKIVVPRERLVRVEREGSVLTGYGFESDPDLRHYEFMSRVSATVRTPANEPGSPSRGGR